MLFWVLALLETELDANFKTARSVCSRAEEENERQDGEAKPSQTALLKGFMSLAFPKLYEKLDFCWLFQITGGGGNLFFASERIKSHALWYYPHMRCSGGRRKTSCSI